MSEYERSEYEMREQQDRLDRHKHERRMAWWWGSLGIFTAFLVVVGLIAVIASSVMYDRKRELACDRAGGTVVQVHSQGSSGVRSCMTTTYTFTNLQTQVQ